MPVLSGFRWQSTGATTTITWSFGAFSYPSLPATYDGYKDFDSAIDTAGNYRNLIQAAFNAWEAVANVDFVLVADSPSADIRVGNDYIDGGGNTLAQTATWMRGSAYLAAEIYFDADAYQANFYLTALHEIGHAIGLRHSTLPSAVMYFQQSSASGSVLTADDIQGAQAIYGAHGETAPSPQVMAAALNILRTSTNATATDLAVKVAAGAMTAAAAIGQIVDLADATTSVATLSYEFFTGKIPTAGGVDYLVSTTGGNGNNLNSGYYQSFSLENRYINFAVNLGAAGEGKAGFQSAYGSLSLFDATRKAYATIFGGTPIDAKVHALIDSRVDYFAAYGGDGAAGLGTKAAMVGWLLAEGAKADVGVYARANEGFLTDLADGATFAVDLVGVYGRPEYVFAG